MNHRVKIFLMIAAVILILVVFPVLLQGVGSYGWNFAIRVCLIILSIYLILEVMKLFQNKG